MSALDDILEQTPETFEEASQTSALDEIISTRQAASLGTSPKTLPRTVPGKGIGFVESFKQQFIDDPALRVRRIAQQRFPDDPDALQRFGMIDGNIVFVNENGELERPGGFSDFAGRIAGLSPEIAGSVVGSFATSPVLGAAVGASGGRAVKDIIGGALLEDPTTPLGVLQNMSVEAATDLVAGIAGKALVKAAEKGSVRGIDSSVFKSEQRREQIKNATGIELDLAQVTNLPKLKDLKRWAANFPGEAAEVIQASTEMQQGQVDEAITRLVNVISRESDPAKQGFAGINAAKASIDAARIEVADRTSGLYQRSFQSEAVVDVQPVLNIIDEKLKSAKGSRATRLKEARRLLDRADGKGVDQTVEGLHNTKLAIDEMFERKGSEALSGTIRRDLVDIKSELLDQLSEASPLYNQAREKFAELSAQITEPLENSIVGVLADIPDRNAATAAAKMFSGGNVDPSSIRMARKAITSNEGGEEAWNGLVRQWLMDQFNRASREIQIGEEANLAGKFRQKVIGTRAQKAAMIEALGPEAQPLFDITMEALQMVARTPTASSATAFNQEITRELSNRTGSIIQAGLQPRKTAIQAIDDRHLENVARRIAEALTDPSKRKQLNALKELRPGTERAVIASSIIGLSILPRDLSGNLLFPPESIVPPVLQ